MANLSDSDAKTEVLCYEYKNVSCLLTSPGLLSHLQDLKLDGGEKVVSFQWLGPHFLTFLNYETEKWKHLYYSHRKHGTHVPWSCQCHHLLDRQKKNIYLLKRLDDSASDCILYGETEHYKDFLDTVLDFMPQIKGFFTFQNPLQPWGNDCDYASFPARFISFIVEAIGELLNCRTNASVLVSNQVKVLLKELKFLLTFYVDTIQSCNQERNSNILKEIEALFNEAGLFLHSFYFTTDIVIATKMDLEVSVLLERIEILQVKIKDYCIAVSQKLNPGIGSLQVAASRSELSSSIHTAEEMIVGLENMTTQIANKLLRGPNYRQIISIVGMGGLGKTTLAKKLYNHSNVRYHFDKLSWCVVSQTHKKRKLLIDILSSASTNNLDQISGMEDEEDLADRLYKSLKGRRYLIVMDDLWDKEAWDVLERLFPEDRNGSRVLFTSRLKNMASEISHVITEPPPLSPGESWNLLEQNVFKKECCPQVLQDIGKKIATNCNGLPLSIITIAGVLSSMEKKESLWQQVAESLSSYVSQNSNDYIPTLKLSYMHLPCHLKPCFLYLSAFQEDEEILTRKLLSLWIAEGFIKKKEHKSLEDVAEEYLMELIDRSLLQVSKRRSNNGVKACTLHDLVLDMCSKIAVEDEIFLFQHQFLISKHRHRLCMDRSRHLSKALSILYSSEKIRVLESRYDTNVLLGIKIMPDLRFLEISSLDLSGRLQNLEFFLEDRYEIPLEISSLDLLSVGRLQNLEFLLVKDGYDIPTYLLSMSKLRHLHIGKKVRPARLSKNCDSSGLISLQTFSYIYIDDSKDEEILRSSPNLRRLKCKSSVYRFPDLNFLSQLESLTMAYESSFEGDYSVVNFPRYIKKLTLSEIGLPWESMSLIGTLPNLEILKLDYKAFKGDIWNTKDDEFQKLKILKLHHLDFKWWNSSYDHFPILENLLLRYCTNLEMIPSEFSNIPTLQKIEVYYCGNNVESSAQKIREEQLENGNEEFDATVHRIFYMTYSDSE